MKVKKILPAVLALALSASVLAAVPGSAEETAPVQPLFGDIDGNGEVTANDAACILKYVAAFGAGVFDGTLDEYMREKSQPQTIKDGGEKLTIASWNDNDLKNMIEVFHQDYPDITVEYVNCGANSGADANVKYKSFLNSGEGADLFIAESGWILDYLNNEGYSVPLSELGITEADYQDAYSYTVDIGTDNNGILKGASWQAAPGGFCYNTTLAKQYLGVETPEEMQAKISDWDKFASTAAELYEATDGAVTVTATMDGMWQCYASAANAPWVIDGKVNTETALNFTNMLIPYVTNDYIDPTIEQWSTEWKTLGKENKTLGYFFSTWCLTSGTQLEENCGTDGNWNIVVGPQEYFWGGSWLCVSPKCDNKTEAAQFIRYFTSDAESMEKYALAFGDFVNNKSVMEKISAGDYSNPLLGGQNQFAVLKNVAENIKLNETITPYDETLKQALRYALYSNIFNGDAQQVIDEFLVQAKNDVPELFPEEETATESQETTYPEAVG